MTCSRGRLPIHAGLARRRVYLLAALLVAFSTPAAADTVTFVFTFDAAAAGLAGQGGEIGLSIRGNQAFSAVWSNFSAPGALGTLLMETCTTTGSLSSQLNMTNTDTTLPGLPACVYNPAITAFPSTLSIQVTATFPTGLPIELEFSVGNANDFFVGAGIAYLNTDGNGNVITGFNPIPGAVNIFTYPNFAVNPVNPVPEPGTLALVGTGLTAAIVRRRKRIS